MASNSFGTHFRITTWGESHGPAIGVVIDGCPPGVPLLVEEIQQALDARRPGTSPYTSHRQERDRCEVLSGVYEGKTTGAPISLVIRNEDARSSAYDPIRSLHRPGHATFTYLAKYGHFDPRGGGRASARETAARVAAGAVAAKFLSLQGIQASARLVEMGGSSDPATWPALIEEMLEEGDSLGGIVEGSAILPAGLGDPIYLKLEALLAFAMLSLPASKGFEIGEGFQAARMRGSEHNDLLTSQEGRPTHLSNHAGGTLGGISTGEPLLFRVAFKPTSSIRKPQATVTFQGERAELSLGEGHRHDPCVAIRAVPVVTAMTSLVLADCLVRQNSLAHLGRVV